MYKWWCHTGTVPSQCVSIHIRGLHRLSHMYFLFLLLLPPKYRSISLSALHECETPRHRDGSGLTQGHTAQIIMSRVTHQLLWGIAEENVVQHDMLHYHHGTVFQIRSEITKSSCHLWQAEESEAGPNWLLVLQTLKSLQREKLGMSLAEDTPGYCEDITNWGTCILWLFFLTLGSHARKKLVGKQRGKEQLFLWGPDRRKKNVGAPGMAMEQKTWNIFSPICSVFSTLWVLLPSFLTLPQLAWWFRKKRPRRVILCWR